MNVCLAVIVSQRPAPIIPAMLVVFAGWGIVMWLLGRKNRRE